MYSSHSYAIIVGLKVYKRIQIIVLTNYTRFHNILKESGQCMCHCLATTPFMNTTTRGDRIPFWLTRWGGLCVGGGGVLGEGVLAA